MKAAKALKEKGETPEELLRSIKENEAAVAEAQRTVDAWKAIVGEKSRREEASKAEAERIERKAAEERERAEAEEEARVEAERKAEEERKTEEEERKERDENGQPFVVSSDGTTTFGEITEDTGLTAAPIKLSEGFQDANTGKGYGLVHIEANHGEQIRQAGFTSVKEFVSFVATHYDPDNIRVGKRRDDGSDTFLIQVTDTHDNTLFIELSKDGSYWNVNSGGIFRKGYSNKKETVAKTEPQQPTNAVSSDSSLSANVKDGITNAEPNGEPTVSLDKGTTLPADQQTSDEKNTKKVADSEGENTLKAKIEAASADVNTEPTEAQKEAGNYKKGHVQVGTFDITIEQPEGSIRRGTDADGKKWESKMHNTYGYFRGTEGVDGDHIDVFLSNDIDGWNGRKVFVVDQYNPDGTFDEHKVMLGFNDMDEAKSDYLANYEKGWENGRRITVSTTNLEDFEKWIDSSHRKTKPFSEYSSVNKETVATGKGGEKPEKKQEKQSVFDKAKEIADKEEKKRKAEAEDDKPKEQSLTEAERKDAEEVAGALGYRVEWVDTMAENGTIDADKKVIRIAKDAENPLVQVLGHEVAHGVKRMDGGKFKALQKAAMEVVGEKEWNERIEKKRKLNAYAEGKLAEEVTCDIVGEALNDKDALKRLAESLRGEKGILARLRDAVARMVEYFKNRGDKEGVRRMKAADRLLAEFEGALKEDVASGQANTEGVDRSVRESGDEPENKRRKDFAERFGVDESYVSDYANGMAQKNTGKAARARRSMERQIYLGNAGKTSKLSDIAKSLKSFKAALKEAFGDLDALIDEYRKLFEEERNMMEAARKKAEDEAAARKRHLDELSLLTDGQIDSRYAEALEKGDETEAREMLDEVARRKGYGDENNEYRMQHRAPSNPGYESDEARRNDIENGPDVNLEDIALGYNRQPDDYFTNPRGYLNDTPHGRESTDAVANALSSIRQGGRDVTVKVYRAVPTTMKEGKLRNGDWVSLSRRYAEMHGNHALNGKYRIMEDEVPAKDIWWDGNDVNEFGYDNGEDYKYKNVKNNRKSDDLVTRDDKGNVIPPSKRFNQRKADERYSRRESKALTAEERELRDNLVERMRKGGLDVVTDSEEMQRVIDTENERTRESRKRRSAVAEERLRVGNTIDEAMAAATHLTKEEARAMRREWERKFKEETKELYGRVLSGNFDDVTLRLIDEFIDKSTPNNPYGRPLSKRLPPRVGQKMRGGERTGSIDALFSRISESAVGKDGKALPRAERERAIEEKKKELLKKWAIATGNWHTDIADFTDQREPIGNGTDSDVYLGKDGKSVIKVSKGKPYGKRFRPDVDNVALFNSVFRNSAYTIVGYGEVDGKFVRFLKQPIVDFTSSTPLTEGERVAYMEKLGFKPINKENTAFSNGEIIASDLQKSNIVKDKQGNVRVIDADMKLHTKDFGGKFSYPDAETDTRTDGVQRFLRTAGGEVYGLVKDGRIYLDPKVATSETAVHEYTHLWGDMLRRKDSEQWSHTVKELKNSVLWEEVKELYPELKTDDEIADEVLSTFSGRRGAERLREEARRVADGEGGVFTKAKAIETLERVKEAIARFWEGVARMFGINRYRSAEELADMAMRDLINGVKPTSRTFTFDNFYKDTKAVFEGTERPKGKPDYTSYSGSEYWYGEDKGGKYVVRGSDHWSGEFKVKDGERTNVGRNHYSEITEDRMLPIGAQGSLKFGWKKGLSKPVGSGISAAIDRRGSGDSNNIASCYWYIDNAKEKDNKGFTYGKAYLSEFEDKERRRDIPGDDWRDIQGLEGGTRAMAERIAEQPVEEINNRFNEELEKYQNNKLPKGHRFELGMPSAELQSAGFPTLPISMRSSLLAKKAGAERHPFAPTDLRDLVNAIQKPIAIFNYSKNNMRNLIVDVSRGGKHFLVGVTLNYKADNIEINSVSGLFPKENHEWIKWIQDGKVLRIDQKEKVQDLINSLRTNPAESERIGLNLDDVAKKVKDFENPKLFDGKISEVDKKGSDSTDRSVRENPKNEDKPRYSRKPGESIFDYASRVSEDVDRIVRERVSARDEYEKKVKSKGFQTKEALQNSMLGLQEFMSAIDHASGNKRYIEDIPDFENPILGENRLSSVNKEESHSRLDAVHSPTPTKGVRKPYLRSYTMIYMPISSNVSGS